MCIYIFFFPQFFSSYARNIICIALYFLNQFGKNNSIQENACKNINKNSRHFLRLDKSENTKLFYFNTESNNLFLKSDSTGRSEIRNAIVFAGPALIEMDPKRVPGRKTKHL